MNSKKTQLISRPIHKSGLFVFLFLLLLLSFRTEIKATVTMTYPFTDSMVVQRNQTFPVWGVAASGETVAVTFNGQTKSIITPTSGKWKVIFDPMIENGPLIMTVKGNNTITFHDIYVGEVWNCAGQSNMDTRLSYYSNLADTIKTTRIPLLRYIDVRYSIMGSNKGWHAISPSTAGGCSATAYFFGKQIQKKLGCAVGLLVTAVGGTYVEQWLDPATIATNPNMVVPKGIIAGDMFNQFIAPVLTYGIKGTVCMHGEQNAGDTITAPLYGERFKMMITGWRKAWGQENSSFFYGQITMFNTKAAPDPQSPIVQVREGQRSALALPYTGMTVNLDLSGGGWHFTNKYEAGRRLSLLALAKDYGQKTLEYSGPVFQKMGIQSSKVKMLFNHAGSGLKTSDNGAPTGFFMAGADNVWYVASAAPIVDSTIVVTCASVTAPVRVSYVLGKTSYNLFNKDGLPASPFNTDFQYEINGKNQIIYLTDLKRVTLGAPDFSPATTTSGLKITYESDNQNIATISSDGLVHLVGAGICNIKAYQPGDSTYRSSVSLTMSLIVSKGTQIITFPDPAPKTYGDSPFELTASVNGSGLPVTYSVATGDAISLSGNMATILKAGTVTIKATQAGNAVFYAATAVSKNLVISKAPLTVTALDTLRKVSTENPVFRLKYTGFVNLDTENSLDVKPVGSSSANGTSPVGDFIISPMGGIDNNYSFVYVDGKLSVNEASGLNEIRSNFAVYPVPVSNQLTIELFEPANKMTVIIETLNGQKMVEKTLQSISKMNVDCSAIASGIYILKVCKDSQVVITRFVKQ